LTLTLAPLLLACTDVSFPDSLDLGEPTFTYEGYVRAADDGTPIEGASVSIYAADGEGGFDWAASSRETEADGFYSGGLFYCPLSLGRAYVQAVCTGLCTGWADSEPSFVSSCEPAVQRYDFELVPEAASRRH
jgi:hypothetical protein